MKSISPVLPLVVLALFLLISPEIRGASIFGKVIEVNDGDIITIFNLNRPVKIRFLGVDAPESNQAFGDVAKAHLRTLVFDKFVLVEYSGLGKNGLLIGKVLFEGRDVGAQMIRDGVAWFDPNSRNQLSESDCDVYFRSEQAARSEKRGLWQVDGAIAPWEFVRSEEKPRDSRANPVGSTTDKKNNRETPKLTNESLLENLSSNFSAGSHTGSVVSSPLKKAWQRFQPTGESFSVLVPAGGSQLKEPIPFGDSVVDVNCYVARDGSASYAVMWATGPSKGEEDLPAMRATLRGFLRGISASYENAGRKFVCDAETENDISLNGFRGREFSMSGCTPPVVVRVFTKVSGKQREMYLGAVISPESDPNMTKFLQSFTVSPTR